MELAFFASSILLFIVFIAISFINYKKKENEVYLVRNHFPYELFKKNNDLNVLVNVIMMLSFLLTGANFILFAVNFYDVSTLLSALMAVAVCLSFIMLFIIPLSKFREHCSLMIMVMTFSAILNGFLIYKEVRLLKIIDDYLLLLPIIINSISGAFALIAIFHPGLFKFNMERDAEGNMIRPKFFLLAFSEWVLMGAMLLSQISIVVVRLVS